ncbi:reticulon-like protein B13 [Manihot esculenta]|uniref:Reticulon-like protein n=1 Tax=Manihot esculenta TaxID=3983 RepID=A0A2C9USH5_MANES|nr:reticulon-like protein B13 [Manihot esculenta]OAY33835.1 hypothetical protein MANES_13G128900v8 [Manihot esculenta]
MSDASKSLLFSSDTVRDILLWRRKKLSLLVLIAATAAWVLLDVYEFNFITIASWATMVIISLLFLYGNLVRLFGKEEPNLSGFLEVPEQTAIDTAKSLKEMIEVGIRWMFELSAAEKDWFVFARVVALLWLLSLVGSCFDLLTLSYIVILVGMTVPVIYMKYEERIKGGGEWMKQQARRFSVMVDDKVWKKVKNKFHRVDKAEEKEKKVEHDKAEEKETKIE